jgi:hypothetical protein
MKGAEMIRPGLWRMTGAQCKCGGELRARDLGNHWWRLFCDGPHFCGWIDTPTLRNCIAAAPRMGKKGVGKDDAHTSH